MKIIFLIILTLGLKNTFAKESIKLSTQIGETHYEAEVYETKNTPKAILYLTPTIAGVSAIETTNAKYFSEHDFLVILPLPFIDDKDIGDPEIEKMDRDFLKPVDAASTFLEMARSKYKLPSNLPIFALGASQGGIRTTMIAGNVPGITAAWATTVGGDFASIYAHSTVEKIALFREKQMKFLNLTSVDEYEKLLREKLTNDPLLACQKIGFPWVQTIALKDDKVPTANQELIAKNCPNHQIIKVNTGHVEASLTTVLWRAKIRKFFENNL